MHIYQLRSSNAAIVTATEQRMHTCMEALREVSKVWLVAKMVHTLFESILGNKTLEERLQKAAGRKHLKTKPPKHRSGQKQNAQQLPQPPDSASKRKFDEVDIGYSSKAPSAPVSYERSRPQTPTRGLSPQNQPMPQHQQQMPAMAPPTQGQTSPNIMRDDAFMGNSRNATRQTTPFNPGNSYPGTPPELYLVTRDSPTISHNVWNNFEPNQLFPAETNLGMPNLSPSQNYNFIDPQLGQQMPPHTPTTANSMHQQQSMQQAMSHSQQYGNHPTLTHRNVSGNPQQPSMSDAMNASHNPTAGGMTNPTASGNAQNWAHVNAMNAQAQAMQGGGSGPDDTWSNSSVSQAATVPNTLNVEDWFQFFGINGGMDGVSAGAFAS